MKNQKIKIKIIKPKMKVHELNVPAEKKIEKIAINKDSHLPETIESKTRSSALPLLGQNRQAQAGEIRQPAQRRSEQKDEEHIFVSYARNQMSEAEKRRVYSLDLRSGQAARQTATIETGRTPAQAIGNQSQGEIHLERSGEGRAVDLVRTDALTADERAEYIESSSAKYRARRASDFF